MFGEEVPHFGHGAVFVVRGHFHHDGDAAGTIAFVKGFHKIAARVLTGAFADGGFNSVLGQVYGFGRSDGRPQTGIARGIAAVLGGDDDFLGGFGENLAALGVLASLAVLDVGPFAVT